MARYWSQVDISVGDAELYDPVTGIWSGTGKMNVERFDHTAVLLPNGTVLVVGGRDSLHYKPISSAELYDPATERWSLTQGLTSIDADVKTVLLPNSPAQSYRSRHRGRYNRQWPRSDHWSRRSGDI